MSRIGTHVYTNSLSKSVTLVLEWVSANTGSLAPKERQTAGLTAQERLSIDVLLNGESSDFVRRFPMSEAIEAPDVERGDPLRSNSLTATASNLMPDLQSTRDIFGESAYDWTNGSIMNLDFFFDSLGTNPFEFGEPNFDFQPGTTSSETYTEDYRAPDLACLGNRALEIKRLLHKNIPSLDIPENSENMLSHLRAIDSVSASNIEDFTRSYFSNFHKHAPIVHKQSFDLSRVALPLLLGVYCIGAIYSRNILEAEQVKALFDLIEVSIFESDSIKDKYEVGTPSTVLFEGPDAFQRRLEELQGMYLLVVAQFFSGNPVAKQRAANHRFSSAVKVLILSSIYIPTSASRTSRIR
jgi:hypothetical protein